jgi:putative SOS response-associated peptidase YedK
MRWGFHRDFNPAINNARSDKLEGGMWKEAFHVRRCVIPMSLFLTHARAAIRELIRTASRLHPPQYGAAIASNSMSLKSCNTFTSPRPLPWTFAA